MNVKSCQTAAEAFQWIREEINNKGYIHESRGKRTKELMHVMVEIEDPTLSIVPLASYNWDFISQEVRDIMTENEVSAIHSKEMLEYTMGSADAKFFFGAEVREALSPWSLDAIIELFKEDKNTRKAVLDLGNRKPEEHIPCLSFSHLLIRDNKLHCTLETRSTDLAFGYPYDTVLFTVMQRYMLHRLQEIYPELELGSFFYKSICMHYYLKDDTDSPLKDLVLYSNDYEDCWLPEDTQAWFEQCITSGDPNHG